MLQTKIFKPVVLSALLGLVLSAHAQDREFEPSQEKKPEASVPAVAAPATVPTPEVVNVQRADVTLGSRFDKWLSGWNASAFSVATLAEMDVAEKGGGRLSSYNHIGFKRYLSGGWRGGFNIPFIYSTAGYDRFNGDRVQKEEFQFEDIPLEVSNSKFAALPGEVEMYQSFRLYLPTGDHSRLIGQVARLRSYSILTKKFATWFETEYHGQVSYYHQSRSVYLNEFEGDNGFMVRTASLTRSYKVEQWVEGWVNLWGQTSVGWQFGTEDNWYNSSDIEGKRKEKHRVSMGPQMRFKVFNGLNVILAVEEQVGNQDDSSKDANYSDYGKFLPENTQVTLLSFIDI